MASDERVVAYREETIEVVLLHAADRSGTVNVVRRADGTTYRTVTRHDGTIAADTRRGDLIAPVQDDSGRVLAARVTRRGDWWTRECRLVLDDLSDETLVACLAALRREIPAMLADPTAGRSLRLLASGMALAGEAWRRQLIAVPSPMSEEDDR